MAKRAKKAAGQAVLAPAPQTSVVATAQVDINGQLPDLAKAQPKPLNLAMAYWSPEAEGESKTLIFMRVQPDDQIPDFNDPEQLVTKDCAYFIEQTEQGFQILRNASSRLVSMARHFLEGEVFRITYLGLRPNKPIGPTTGPSSRWTWRPEPREREPAPLFSLISILSSLISHISKICHYSPSARKWNPAAC
jgi:hypothetical protein